MYCTLWRETGLIHLRLFMGLKLSKLAQSFLQAKVETGAGSQTGSKTTDVNMTTCYKLVHVLNCDVLSV